MAYRPWLFALFVYRPLFFLSPLYSNVEKDGKITTLALHAKCFVGDGENLYIGTLNSDQRLAVLNTEVALINRSRKLAGQVERAIRKDASPENSWLVLTDGSGAPQRLVKAVGGDISRRSHRSNSTSAQRCFRYCQSRTISRLLSTLVSCECLARGLHPRAHPSHASRVRRVPFLSLPRKAKPVLYCSGSQPDQSPFQPQ